MIPLPTKWFLTLVLAAVVIGGWVAARSSRRLELSPRSASATGQPLPAGTPESGRFRYVDLTGQPAPDFTLADLKGKGYTLSQYRGKVVMLVFWATWCKTCPLELPHLAAIARSLEPKGLVTLSINWEKDPGPVVAMTRKTGLEVPVLRDLDQRTRYAYDAFAVPRVIIVDRAGRIARVVRGYEGEATPILKALAEQRFELSGLPTAVRTLPVERVPATGGR